MFLKTATAKEMDIIRESLSNYHDATKNFSNLNSNRKDKDKEDDIEEEFEEEIDELDDEQNDSSNDQEHNFEVIRKDQQSAQQSTR